MILDVIKIDSSSRFKLIESDYNDFTSTLNHIKGVLDFPTSDNFKIKIHQIFRIGTSAHTYAMASSLCLKDPQVASSIYSIAKFLQSSYNINNDTSWPSQLTLNIISNPFPSKIFIDTTEKNSSNISIKAYRPNPSNFFDPVFLSSVASEFHLNSKLTPKIYKSSSYKRCLKKIFNCYLSSLSAQNETKILFRIAKKLSAYHQVKYRQTQQLPLHNNEDTSPDFQSLHLNSISTNMPQETEADDDWIYQNNIGSQAGYIIVSSLVKNSKFSQAKEVISLVTSSNPLRILSLWNVYLVGLANSKRYNEILCTVKEMESLGVRNNLEMHTTIMRGLLKSKSESGLNLVADYYREISLEFGVDNILVDVMTRGLLEISSPTSGLMLESILTNYFLNKRDLNFNFQDNSHKDMRLYYTLVENYEKLKHIIQDPHLRSLLKSLSKNYSESILSNKPADTDNYGILLAIKFMVSKNLLLNAIYYYTLIVKSNKTLVFKSATHILVTSIIKEKLNFEFLRQDIHEFNFDYTFTGEKNDKLHTLADLETLGNVFTKNEKSDQNFQLDYKFKAENEYAHVLDQGLNSSFFKWFYYTIPQQQHSVGHLALFQQYIKSIYSNMNSHREESGTNFTFKSQMKQVFCLFIFIDNMHKLISKGLYSAPHLNRSCYLLVINSLIESGLKFEAKYVWTKFLSNRQLKVDFNKQKYIDIYKKLRS
ncbi:hypothetical protein AYI70_g5830 [Smittium culicis]|uniref:Pentatricopeptide repeat-containing protein n=1 Tax=Smittium culicis TaxID=133412 RepID=A0A1R1XKA6_9FUNG|nr:hypothetical protein AYI70_g7507 [Smittium culicis]OMJ17661.1 hypothetical protein AYI70_g5830 [Smittium culicis]